MREVGPPATADVAVERELGDRQDRAADVRDAVVQSPAIVLEQAKLDDLAREPLAVLRAVVGADADHHDEALADLGGSFVADADRGGPNASDDCSQACSSPVLASRRVGV